MGAPFHLLPSVHELLQVLVEEGIGQALALECARAEVEAARQEIKRGGDLPQDLSVRALRRAQALGARSLVPVINGTGVVLHTNLGRAPLAPEAMAAVAEVGAYCNLELRLESGERGGRLDGLSEHLCALCGTEAAIAVNNNAAAVLLALTALGRGKEILVSRGELVEIGGSFRVPDVISAGGARLVEVGTTNRTRVSDYEAAIGADTALILRVHPSNFKMSGFTERPRRVGLVDLGRRMGLPVVEDLGSGLIETLGTGMGPTVRQVMETGVDLACFSGDKLLGGPQAGLIVGSAELVGRLRRHPLYRALRLDKLSLAALEATLSLYRRGQADRIPLRRMLQASSEDCRASADRIAAAIEGAVVEEGHGLAGGGALPGCFLPGPVVALRVPGLNRLAASLRQGRPSVLLRVSKEALIIDPRTLMMGDEAPLIEALKAALAAAGPER